MKKKSKKKAVKKNREEAPSEDSSVENEDVESGTKKGRTPSVDYAEFVKLWVSSESASSVAEELGIKVTSASAIANRLRKKGVDLKRFPRRDSQEVDVKRLNRIAAGKED